MSFLRAVAQLRLKWSRLTLSVPHVCRSHNPLGDDGLRELLVGIKRVRARDIGSHLEVRLQWPPT